MRRVLLTLTIGLLVVICAPLGADDLGFSFFGDYLESLRRQAGIPGLSAAVVGTNDIQWQRSFGLQNVERAIPTKSDTPFEIDGLGQTITASLVLRCDEEGGLSLDDRVGQYDAESADANLTIRELLTFTKGTGDNAVFDYRPERWRPLAAAVQACTGKSFRSSVAGQFDRFAMIDSVPGADVMNVTEPIGAIPALALERYPAVLDRLATPYVVDKNGRSSPSQYTATTVTPWSGAVSTVNDLARFDLALRHGAILLTDTLASAWHAPIGRGGQALPHGIGWFVQTYNGAKVVWQFGVADNASSSLMVTVPSRGLTLILLANSDGLVKSFPLATGDLTASPFGRVFLGTFVR